MKSVQTVEESIMALPTEQDIEMMQDFTEQEPMRILVSACLYGDLCGFDGTSYGDTPWIRRLISLPNVNAVKFCPEDFSFGTPRNLPDIHGGDGFDVLTGNAKVLTDKDEDWTLGMIAGASQMLKLAQENAVHLAILMDMSAMCGSQVISDGCRLDTERKYRKGYGVAAALLKQNGFKVISQRDFRRLELIYKKLDPKHIVNDLAIDHHETPWYREYFRAP